MYKVIRVAATALALFAGASAQAGIINDTGASAYWGGDTHGYGDVIGNSTFDVHSATITRVGDELKIGISTNFAGYAGIATSLAPGGVAYGDLFLAQSWTPFGSDANYASSNASNGTVWSYGFSLDDRWSNTGGSFKLYRLNGATNAANTNTAESFMSCNLGSDCHYRNGQAVAVDTASSTVMDTGLTGTWTVTKNELLEFSIKVSSTDLMNYSSIAMHWGETCQNDVIEGQVALVPTPGILPLMALGLTLLAATRRRARRS